MNGYRANLTLLSALVFLSTGCGDSKSGDAKTDSTPVDTVADTNQPEDTPTPTCQFVDCDANSHCEEGSCVCDSGYEADTTGKCTAINECDPNPCENGGICNDAVADYSCVCTLGYGGKDCELVLTNCDPNPCNNGGKCIDGIASFSCECKPGFTGPICTKEYASDLDGDGTGDTNFGLGPCPGDTGTCLSVNSTLTATSSVFIASTSNLCDGHLHGSGSVMIGDHTSDGIGEIAVSYCRHDGIEGPPAVAVVNVALGSVIAEAQAPTEQDNAWFAAPAGPDGLRWPFLAPSYGDGLDAVYDNNWGSLCAFRPELPASPACGPGFVSAPATPSPTAFREVGGTLYDLDGDGWEDITLIFHTLVHTLSGASLTPLQTLEFDVAEATEPNSPKWFHSGRNYGTHSVHASGSGAIHHAIIGGAPVGSFTDYNCNVSRFVAVLTSTAGQPATRHLAWAKYFGFASTTFSVYDAAWASNPSEVVARTADVMDDCIHRFGDSRSVMDNQPVLIFNYFDQSAPIDACITEQYQLYLPPTWTDKKADAWYGCFAKNVTSPGTWSMQVLRESDGLGLTGSQGTYVWGMSQQITPFAGVTYLVESFPGPTAFDLSDTVPSPIQVKALVGGLWTLKGVFPVPGRPLLRSEPASGPHGVGSYTAFAELTMSDRDGDGLLEVQLEDGTWVGWSTQKLVFVVKE